MISKFDKIGFYINETYNIIFGDTRFIDSGKTENDQIVLHAIYSVAQAIIEPPKELFNSEEDYDEYNRIIDDPEQNLNFIKALMGEYHPVVEVAKYISREGY